MQRNVGGLDRILRIAIGLALAVLAATGAVGAWGWLGVPVLLTGLVGWCGAYRLLGVATCKAPGQPGA